MKKVFTMSGFVVGVAFLAIGLYILFIFSGSFHKSYHHTKDAEFGGDFYTYQYEATQNAGDNIALFGEAIQSLADDIITFVGIILCVTGLAVICFFGMKYAELDEQEELIKRIENIQRTNTETLDKNQNDIIKLLSSNMNNTKMNTLNDDELPDL